jgi:small basic protein (TIGR04137 family)
MSLDPSLKSASSLVRHRNVLTRDERLARLKDEEKWPEGRSVFGLPKVANRKANVGKAEKEETAEGAEGATPAAGGAAPAAKGAAPAAKGAAPAAKAPAAAGAKGGAGATAAPAKKK